MKVFLRNLEHSHDDSQTFGHPKAPTLGQSDKGQSQTFGHLEVIDQVLYLTNRGTYE